MTTMSRRQVLRTAAVGAGASVLAPSVRSFAAASGSRFAATAPAELIPDHAAVVVDGERAVRRQLPRRGSRLLRGRGTRHHVRARWPERGRRRGKRSAARRSMNISGGDGVARSNMEGAGLTIVGMQYQKSPATLLSSPRRTSRHRMRSSALASPSPAPTTRRSSHSSSQRHRSKSRWN